MPKLKQLPTNAYETLCAELASSTEMPFGTWCALDGRGKVGYVSHVDFARAAEDCRRDAADYMDNKGFSEADVAVLTDIATYLDQRAKRRAQKHEPTGFQSWLAEEDDPEAAPKPLRDPHAIGLLFLDHGQAHTAGELQSHTAELLAQYAVLEAEGRRIARPGVPRTIWGFTPIEKNRSFASTSAKIGQLMGYLGYSEKDAELPLADPKANTEACAKAPLANEAQGAATAPGSPTREKGAELPPASAVQDIPSTPKQEGNNGARRVQSCAKRSLFLAVESGLEIVRASASGKDLSSPEPVEWRWGFAQGNRTDTRTRLGLLGTDHERWLASGRVLALWFAQSCKGVGGAAGLAEEAQAVAKKVASQCAQDGREKDSEALASHTNALMSRWAATQGARTNAAEQNARVVNVLLTPLFAATLCCVARHNLAQCGFDAALVEVGVGTVPATSDEPCGPEAPVKARRAEYVTLRVSRIPTAERGSGRAQDVESRAFELGTVVRIGRAPSYAAQGSTSSRDDRRSGSAPVAELALGDPAVSRLALVLHTEDALELEVLNENTYLRGQRLEKGSVAALVPGDAVMVLGKFLDFVIEVAQLG